MSATASIEVAPPGVALRTGLWIAQVLVFVAFSGIGLMKLLTPIPELAVTVHWAAEYPVAFVRAIGLIDLAGGLGILLPALTRIKPSLTVAAALGCTVLQVFAIVFHFWRGEAALTSLNFVLLPLAVFVLWGRARKAPIRSRA